jgi:hypothetical protein
MKSSYHIDPKEFSLQYLEENLTSRELIPSRKALVEDIHSKFKLLGDIGIQTLDDLLRSLKNKKGIEEVSGKTGISLDYLTLLRREANSYLPNPVSLSKLPGVDSDVISILAENGIKNSRHMYERACTESDRKLLSEMIGLSSDVLKELVGLSDLVRAYGVGPVFARILFDTGIHSIQELIQYTSEEIIQLYEDKFHQKADFSLRDMNFSLEIAKSLYLGVDF